jgi:cellulose synthase/poly-beta-1,6-N-acetylglucosamine synthase-like glycosyltransferase
MIPDMQNPLGYPEQLPEIDCVVIGVNAEATLYRCLNSILECSYPRQFLNIIYVDGGSHDGSISIAESLPGVHTVRLNLDFPSPGLGRNAGWKAGSAELVQFLDSDTVLDKDWLRTAVTAFEPDIAAVAGYREEMHPEHSVYNWIGSLEWNGKPGDADSFGGDVMIRRQVLEDSGGYDEQLVGGEDPELSLRIRSAGWRLKQLDSNMTLHDLAMTRFSQYWKRAYRSGYGFAAVIDKYSSTGMPFWQKEFHRIVVRGGGFWVLSLLSVLLILLFPVKLQIVSAAVIFESAALFLLLYPRFFRVSYFMRDKQLERKQARVYAWHCSLVVLPDILGVARFYLGKFCNRPLRNRRKKLATSTFQPQP